RRGVLTMMEKAPLGITITALGFVATSAVLFWALVRRHRRLYWAKSEGEVVEMDADSSGGYSPVVVYEPSPGEKVRFSGNVVTNPPRYKVGDKVVVVFDPDDPGGALIDRALEHYFVPAVLGFLSLSMFAAGLAVWLL